MSNLEKKVLLAIKEIGKERVDVDEIGEKGFKQVEVMNALSWMKVKGIVKIHERLEIEFCLNKYEELPERKIYDILKEKGEIKIGEIFKILPKETVNRGIGHLKGYGIKIEGG